MAIFAGSLVDSKKDKDKKFYILSFKIKSTTKQEKIKEAA